jgi:hypothetical protein
MRTWKTFVIAGLSTLLFSAAAPAYFDEYDDSQSNPLRVVAYVIHPVGYTLEWLVARPIHALVSQPELEPVFGHTPHSGWANETAVPTEAMLAPTAPPPVAAAPTANPADLEAARRAAEDARASAEEAKRAAEEAARAADKASRAFEKGLRK